jgi:hypothetical protein
VAPTSLREVLMDAVRYLNATMAVAHIHLRDFATHVRSDLATIKERSLRDNALQMLHCAQSLVRWAGLKIRLVASRHLHLGLGPPETRTATEGTEGQSEAHAGTSSESSEGSEGSGTGNSGDADEGEEEAVEEEQEPMPS